MTTNEICNLNQFWPTTKSLLEQKFPGLKYQKKQRQLFQRIPLTQFYL
jgi:hypothetical protein